MTRLGPELDAARARVVERGLTADAIAQLTPLVRELPPEALTPVKQLLKQFFSDRPWTTADDDALADVVGPGTGSGEHELEPGLQLTWRWVDGRFQLRVTFSELDLEQTFQGAIVPEATPSPRTIRFATPPIHSGPSRTYDSADAAATEPRVARLFEEFDDVNNVLVGPDFVAVTISRPDRWEQLLVPMLRAVAAGFTGDDEPAEAEPVAPMTISFTAGSDEEGPHAPRRLERAWTELGALRADRPEHLDDVIAASRDDESARRQVAAALLADAPPDAARRAWERMLEDSSRAVRRSVVDAVAGSEREELRPLLERALDDSDAWVRWKALHGIAALGVGASRAAVEARAADGDFRVRLEAARALAG